jgi:hypothetical protein
MANRYFTEDGWAQFQQIAKRRGKPDNGDIAAVVGLDIRTIQRWEAGEGVKDKNFTLLQEKFGLSRDQILSFTKTNPQERKPANAISISRVSGLREQMQDRKNVIFKPEIRERILNTEHPPSVVECVCASRMHLPAGSKEKDTPIVANTEFNLFFQVGAVLQVILPQSRKVVTMGAPRKKILGTQKYDHTTGFSILFGASFPFNVAPDEPMDRWVAGIEVNSRNAERLTENPDPLLLHILKYKLDIVGFDTAIRPFAVVLRNESLEGQPRAYCQYIFHIVVDWATVDPHEGEDISTQLRLMISSPELDIVPLPASAEPERLFRSENGKLNLMDLLAFQRLQGRSGVLVAGDNSSTKLFPGFNLVPNAPS